MPILKSKYLVPFLLLTLVFCLPAPMLHAQDSTKNTPYELWLKGKNPPVRLQGFLLHLTDSSVVINRNWQHQTNISREFQVEQIQWLKFRKQESIMRGVGVGALAGIAAAFVWEALKKDSPRNSNKIIKLNLAPRIAINSIITVPIFATIGGVAGSIKTVIPINGSRDEFAKQRSRLEQFQLGY